MGLWENYQFRYKKRIIIEPNRSRSIWGSLVVPWPHFHTVLGLLGVLGAPLGVPGCPIWVLGFFSESFEGPGLSLGRPGELWMCLGASSAVLGCPWERRGTSLGSPRGALEVLGNRSGCVWMSLRVHWSSVGSPRGALAGFANREERPKPHGEAQQASTRPDPPWRRPGLIPCCRTRTRTFSCF